MQYFVVCPEKCDCARCSYSGMTRGAGKHSAPPQTQRNHPEHATREPRRSRVAPGRFMQKRAPAPLRAWSRSLWAESELGQWAGGACSSIPRATEARNDSLGGRIPLQWTCCGAESDAGERAARRRRRAGAQSVALRNAGSASGPGAFARACPTLVMRATAPASITIRPI